MYYKERQSSIGSNDSTSFLTKDDYTIDCIQIDVNESTERTHTQTD